MLWWNVKLLSNMFTLIILVYACNFIYLSIKELLRKTLTSYNLLCHEFFFFCFSLLRLWMYMLQFPFFYHDSWQSSFCGKKTRTISFSDCYRLITQTLKFIDPGGVSINFLLMVLLIFMIWIWQLFHLILVIHE